MIAVVVLIMTAITLYSLLRTPSLQQFAGRLASGFLTERLGHEIRLESVRISDFIYVETRGIEVRDTLDNVILGIENLQVKIDDFSLGRHRLSFERVSIDSGTFAMVYYNDDSLSNLGYFIRKFTRSDTTVTDTTPAPAWHISCSNLLIDRFTYSLKREGVEAGEQDGVNFRDLGIHDISIDMREIAVIGDSISAYIDHLACRENSGLELLNFSGDATVYSKGIIVDGAQISTGRTSLDLDLAFRYDGYDRLSEFLDSVRIEADIRSSLITPGDIGYFVPALAGMDDPVMFSGKVNGPVSDFRATSLSVNLGDFTLFEGDLAINGLPDFDSAFIDLSIDQFATTPGEIANLKFPAYDLASVIPDELNTLGYTSLQGNFSGTPHDFRIDAMVRSEAGNATLNGKYTEDRPNEAPNFRLKVEVLSADLGNLLSSNDLGIVNLQAELNGSGSSLNDLKVDLNALVTGLEYRNYRYNEIVIDGTVTGKSFSGRLDVNDPNFKAAYEGTVDMNEDLPDLDFKLTVDKARLYETGLTTRSEDAMISGGLTVDIEGWNAEYFRGDIRVDNLHYLENGRHYTLKMLNVSRGRQEEKIDILTVRSDYVDADMTGKFNIRDLFRQIHGFIRNDESDSLIFQEMENNPQVADLEVRIKDVNPITELFVPGMHTSPGIMLSGRFSSVDRILEAEGDIRELIYSGMSADTIRLFAVYAFGSLYLDAGMRHLNLSEDQENEGIGIENLQLHTALTGNDLYYAVQWNNDDPLKTNAGEFEGYARLLPDGAVETGLRNAQANINGHQWMISDLNIIRMDSASVGVKNFEIYGANEHFIIDGVLSHSAEDTLSLYFRNWELSNFNPILENYSLALGGEINGHFGLFRHEKKVNIFSALNVNDFTLNEVYLGEMDFDTRWIQSERALAVDLNLFSEGNTNEHFKILGVNGVYYPMDKKRNFDFDIIAKNLDISVLKPFLTSFSSKLAGYTTGRLKLAGTNADPVVMGRLRLQRAEMNVDYLNVTYSFSNEVVFTENGILFNELQAYDPNSQKALISGGIYHDHFRDMQMDITILPDQFMAINLNRYQNEVFYGKAYATGTVHLSGPFDNLSISADVLTEKGSAITIPINYSVDVSENDFIIFSDSRDTVVDDNNREKQVSGLALDLGMNITKDADIEIILPGNIGSIAANGDGNLRLGVDPYGYLNLTGSYVIRSGLFVFSLEQLVSRRFEILEGSSISWTGDIYDAEVSISARYRLRTDLNGLGISMIDPDAANQKVIVNTDIRMSGNLFNPDLKFGITFPNMQEQTRQAVYAVLDTNDLGLMNQQAISLLVLGSFSSTGTGGSNLVNPASIVSNTLSNMLSQINNDFNIGINYMPGDQVSAEQLEVALSTQLLDDRLIIDGNIDVSGSNANTQKTSSIVGDINIEYKLSPDGRFRVKAFNRSNDLSLFNDYAPFTQGIGVFYRKEFDNLRDLFTPRKPKEKKVTRE